MKLISRVWNRARDAIDSRQHVGTDRVGNTYYMVKDSQGTALFRLQNFYF